MGRPTRDELFMEVAALMAGRSTCSRLQVGCVLTDMYGEQLWVGYNGGPRGGRNWCIGDDPGQCGCLHAETNAVIKAPGGVDKVAYVTHSPCVLCAVALVNAHVVRVCYSTVYRDQQGIRVLLDANVEVNPG